MHHSSHFKLESNFPQERVDGSGAGVEAEASVNDLDAVLVSVTSYESELRGMNKVWKRTASCLSKSVLSNDTVTWHFYYTFVKYTVLRYWHVIIC